MNRRPPTVALAVSAIIVIAMVACALLSDGVLQDDDLTHFAMARDAWTFPMYLADDWGRPGFTVPYALVANVGPPSVGFTLCRLLTVAICGVSAWLAWRVSREVVAGPAAYVAPAALLAMPLYFQLGYTTLTETICALYAIGGTWLLLRDRPYLAAIAFSLVPLARHEGVLVLPVVALLLAWRGTWLAIPLLLFGELAWNVGKPLLGYPLSELPIYRFATRGEAGHLGTGGPLHYLAMSGRAFGPAQATFALLGVTGLGISLWRRFRGRGLPAWDAPAAAAFLCAGGTLAMLLVQTYLYAVNTHESGGYPRFLLPAAPWAAICCAAAVAWLLDAPRNRLFLAAGIALGFNALAMLSLKLQGWSTWYGGAPILLPIAVLLAFRPRIAMVAASVVALITWGIAVRPHRLLPHQQTVLDAAAALHEAHPDAQIIGDNPWLDVELNQPRHPYFWAPNDWREPKSLPLFYVWDEDHSSVNLPLAELDDYPHRELDIDGHGFVRVFERLP